MDSTSGERPRSLRGLRDSKTPVVVTGASGFVGSHVARTLAERGHDVRALLRNPYATGRVFHPRITQHRVDLTSPDALDDRVPEGSVVVHAAAFSSPWGTKAAFHAANVRATEHVARACRAANARLVHISSTSVFFAFTDREDLTDDAPWAEPPSCEYASSKGEAERVVQREIQAGLDAVIVRARAVIGPGDNAIVPRLMDAARAGRLPQIGDGENIVDLGYIDNLVHGILLAAERGRCGAAYTITDDEPVKLWEVIRDLARSVGAPEIQRKVSYSVIDNVARGLEAVHSRFPALGEPRLTRYGAGLLATSQTFDITRAKTELGYEPVVSCREGIERTRRWLCDVDEAPASEHVTVRVLETAHTSAPAGVLMRGARWTEIEVPCFFALIEHPRFGRTLFDTGYHPAFVDATKRFPFSLYARITPVQGLTSAAKRLERIGVDPESIDRVLISHFHADHVAGLNDFPRADFIAARSAWDHFRARRGVRGLKRGYLHQVLPADFESRLFCVDRFHGQGFGPFTSSHDLFGDGSVRLVDLSGHAAGQLGALLQTGDGRALLAADACWMSEAFRSNRLPHAITNLLVHSRRDEKRTLHSLHALHRDFPAVDILPSHCPEVHARIGEDGKLRAAD